MIIHSRFRKEKHMKRKLLINLIALLILLVIAAVVMWFTSSIPLKLYDYSDCTIEISYTKNFPPAQMSEEDRDEFVKMLRNSKIPLFGFTDEEAFNDEFRYFVIHLKNGKDIFLQPFHPHLTINNKVYEIPEDMNFAMHDYYHDYYYEVFPQEKPSS